MTPPRSQGIATTRDWIAAIAHDLAIWACVAVLYLWAVGPASGQDFTDCIDATCRITASDGGCGTGTIFEESSDRYRIQTNAHVVNGPRGTQVKVEFWKQGWESGPIDGVVEDAWLRDGADLDIAIVSVPKYQLTCKLPIIPIAEPSARFSTKDIFSVGCSGGAWPTAFHGHIIGASRPNIVEFVPAPKGGRSGSALFAPIEGKMRIVGLIAWRSDDDSHGIAMHLGQLHQTYNGRTQTLWQPELVPGRQRLEKVKPVQYGTCPPGGCDPWQGNGGNYQVQPQRPQHPQQPDPSNPWFSAGPLTLPPDVTDERSLLPWREEIEKKLADLEAKCGQGNQGPPGPQGPAGKDAKAADLDYDKIIAGVNAHINTDEFAKDIAAKLPPVIVELEQLDGTKKTQSRPLGQPIKLKLTQRALELD